MNKEDLAEKVYLEEPHTPEVSFGYCRLCGDEILEDDYYYEYGEKWHPTCYYIMKKGEEEREQNMKYKVGDKVKIREDLIVYESYMGEGTVSDTFTHGMRPYLGKIATITMVRDHVGKYKLDIDGGDWSWTLDMLEDVEEKKVRRPTKFVRGDVVQIKGMDTHLKVDDIDLWGGCSKPDYHLIDRNGAYHGWFDEDDLVLYHPEESYLNYEKSEEFEEAMSHVEEIEKRRVVEDLVYKLADKLIDYLMEV